MVDNDGQFTYSTVVVIEFESKQQPLVLSANPVQNVLEVKNVATGVIKEWQVITVIGQPVIKGKTDGSSIRINVTGLSAGTYWLRVYSQGRIEVVSFIKQ